MNTSRLTPLAVVLWLGLAASRAAAEVAVMDLSCTSVRVPTAATTVAGLTYGLGFTTTDDGTANGELYQYIGNTTYASVALLQQPGSNAPLALGFTVDLPDTGDTDLDLLTDFFEVSHPVNAAKTAGTLSSNDALDTPLGRVTANWSRAAGATVGTVLLQLDSDPLALHGLLFTNRFEIFEYQGQLTYTVSGSNITAAVNLTRQGTADTYSGPFHMTRLDTAELAWTRNLWAGPSNQTYVVLPSTAIPGVELLLTRGATGTNYYGSIFFQDGIPATRFRDEYDVWDVEVIDPNDANHNGIPDLSDVPVSAPTLALAWKDGRPALTVTAQAGAYVIVEQSADLVAPAWTQVDARTLTANAEELVFPAPSSGGSYFRARIP
jgi:hypothetical protein